MPSNPVKFSHTTIMYTGMTEELQEEAEKSITSVEQASLMTDGEIEWVKIKMKNQKDLLIGSFYMPHREQKHLDELQKSLTKISNHKTSNVILAGDFNCPDIRWNILTVTGPDREIQQGLVDITEAFNLTQIHILPTREENLLDIVFATNPILVKTSTNVPGISDHEIVITDFEAKVHHRKTPRRQCYAYKKVKWEEITKDLKKTHPG
jgi:endonuclease/exonuclease/phosphatase (EEP) superfamily protein YafD